MDRIQAFEAICDDLLQIAKQKKPTTFNSRPCIKRYKKQIFVQIRGHPHNLFSLVSLFYSCNPGTSSHLRIKYNIPARREQGDPKKTSVLSPLLSTCYVSDKKIFYPFFKKNRECCFSRKSTNFSAKSSLKKAYFAAKKRSTTGHNNELPDNKFQASNKTCNITHMF